MDFATALRRDRRLRAVTILPLAILGILVGVALGIDVVYFGWIPRGNLGGNRSMAPLMLFVAPPFIGAGIGWVLYRMARAWQMTDGS